MIDSPESMLITSCQLLNCHFSGYWRSHHEEMLVSNSTGFILYLWALFITYASLVAQTVKNWPAMQEIQVQFLGWESPLEKEWQPISVFLTGKSHGQRSLAGYNPWVHKKSDMTEWLTLYLLQGLEDPLEKEMATHSSILAWEIPWTRSLVDCSPWGRKRVGHDLTTKQHQLYFYSNAIGILTFCLMMTRLIAKSEADFY